MKKTKNVGKKIAIIYIVLAIITAILVTTVLYQVISNWGKSESEIAWEEANKEENIVKAEEIMYDNSWGKDIVKEIKENAPIPMGFTYVEGNLNDGLIIEEEGTENKLLWIPYDENANLNVADDYYKNIKVPEMDSKALKSMRKYGGFYVNINSDENYTMLKDINEEDYNTAKENAKQIYEDTDIMNSHLLYKEEIAQIIAYGNKLGVDLVKTSNEQQYTVNKLSNVNGVNAQKTSLSNIIAGAIATSIKTSSNTTKYEDADVGYWTMEMDDGEKIYIPNGFELCSYANRIEISDENNPNLVYVWIPVRDGEKGLKNAQEDIKTQYKNLDIPDNIIPINYIYKMIEEDYTDGLKESLEKCKGFYMAEAELSFTNKEKTEYSTLARDMSSVYSSAITDSEGNVISDYFRKNNLVEDGATADKFVEEAKKVAKKVQSQNSVVSHLTYGAEYDLAIMYLIETNAAKASQLIQDSTEIGKYSGSYSEQDVVNGKISKEKFPFLNGLWGLAGNLEELTQETWTHNGEQGTVTGKILRGGSYATTANILINGRSAQSINTIQNKKLQIKQGEEGYYDSDSIGIRNCLYININGSDDETNNSDDLLEWDGNIADEFERGNGSKNNPYIIKTPEQLAYLAQEVNEGNTYEGKYFEIINSFDMNDVNWTPIGGYAGESDKGNSFKGYLDGKDNTIYNLKIELSDDYTQCIGLIGNLGKGGQVKNINLKKCDVSGWFMVGGIVGYMENATVEKCNYDGQVYSVYSNNYKGYEDEEEYKDGSGCFTGGIVGYQSSGKVTNCKNSGNVIAEAQQAGGIVGVIKGGTIENCTNTGKITTKCDNTLSEKYGDYRESSGVTCGGIAGYQEGGSIKNCNNKGEVIAETIIAGGIVGLLDDGEISKCINDGAVSAKADDAGQTGGIVGYQGNGTVTNCENKGNIKSDIFCGGIIGLKEGGTVKNCENSGKITANDYYDDIIGCEDPEWE